MCKSNYILQSVHNSFYYLSQLLGCGEIVPQPKNSSVSPTENIEDIDETEEIIEVDDGTTGFEECTVDLVESQETKGKVVVNTVLDGESEILDFSDISESIHFEILDDPDIDNHFFEQCGRCKDFEKNNLGRS